MIRKKAWPFYRTSPGVCLCWELEEPKRPEGSVVDCHTGIRPTSIPQVAMGSNLTPKRSWAGPRSEAPNHLAGQFSIQEQLLYIIVKRFRKGLVCKAHRVVYYSTLGSRVIKKKRRQAPVALGIGPKLIRTRKTRPTSLGTTPNVYTGFLAHKKQHSALGSPKGPWRIPTAGS